MKIDFSSQLLGLDGKQIIMPDEKPAVLSSVCVTALMAIYPDEVSLSGDEKYRRYKIAGLIYPGGAIEITAEDVALLKKLTAKCYGPLIVGPAHDALEKPAA